MKEQTMTAPSYQKFEQYRDARPAAQSTIDAVFAAVAPHASPYLGMERGGGVIGCAFTWHDGAKYRVILRENGTLLRLFRLAYTGGWDLEDQDGPTPEVVWRTVRAFSKDRAGRILAAALPGVESASSWAEAVAR